MQGLARWWRGRSTVTLRGLKSVVPRSVSPGTAAVVDSAELWVVCKEGRVPTRAGGWRAPPSTQVGSWAGGPGLCHSVEVTGTQAGTAGRFWLTPELGCLERTRSPLRGRGQAQKQAADTLWAWRGFVLAGGWVGFPLLRHLPLVLLEPCLKTAGLTAASVVCPSHSESSQRRG